MTDNEKRAHDLAILYMQMEIKHEQIRPATIDDYRGFTDEYQHCYLEILGIWRNSKNRFLLF